MHKLKDVFRMGIARHDSSKDTCTASLDAGSSLSASGLEELAEVPRCPSCPFWGHPEYVPLSETVVGTMGLAYLARRRSDGAAVVVKLLERGPGVSKSVASEVLMHCQCRGHPYIVQLEDCFLTERYLALVLERLDGLDLLSFAVARGPLPESLVRMLFQQVVAGLSHFHALGSFNRDARLDSMLLVGEQELEEAARKLAGPESALGLQGWGLAGGQEEALEGGKVDPEEGKEASEAGPRLPRAMEAASTSEPAAASSHPPSARAASGSPGPSAPAAPHVKLFGFLYGKGEQINSDPNSALGSLPYTAPEVLSSSLQGGPPVDVWSAAVALFRLATGHFPFEHPDDAEDQRITLQVVLGRIARVEYAMPEHLSEGARDLLRRCLVRDPAQRMTLADIREHPWVRQDLPRGLFDARSDASGLATRRQTVAEVEAVLEEAAVAVHSFNSENIADLADEILNEEEMDDILEELSLGGPDPHPLHR